MVSSVCMYVCMNGFDDLRKSLFEKMKVRNPDSFWSCEGDLLKWGRRQSVIISLFMILDLGKNEI